MVKLHTLWPIGEDSFRVLINGQARHLPCPDLTEHEFVQPLLGDGLIVSGCHEITRCIDISAPAGVVWAWLAQMMRGAGMYGWPQLEHDGCRSAEYLLDDLVPPQAGDRLGDSLELVVAREQDELVWHTVSGVDVLDLQIDQLTLDYHLEQLGAEDCRLVARVRAACPALTTQLAEHLAGVIDFALPMHQLQRIKALAEANGSGMSRPCCRPDLQARHQIIPCLRQ